MESRHNKLGGNLHINEMNDVLAKLDWKLDGYEDRMVKFEEDYLKGGCHGNSKS